LARYKTILIAGPTASGKSNLALALAAAHNGVIINTDSMQVYRDLRLITARPSVEDEAFAAHRLYGEIDGVMAWSTGVWLRAVEAAAPQLRNTYDTLIFVGGTGLYFNALTLGLSKVPETPADLRNDLRAELAAIGAPELNQATGSGFCGRLRCCAIPGVVCAIGKCNRVHL
jgi:tRNA dimethylallyltransferase